MILMWISLTILLLITIGFAGLVGNYIYHLRSSVNSHQVASAIGIYGLILLPSLSLPPVSQWISWLVATLVVVIFAIRPTIFPHQLWTIKFAFRYTSLVMVLIAIWSLTEGYSHPVIILGGLAALAALLSYFRSRAANSI